MGERGREGGREGGRGGEGEGGRGGREGDGGRERRGEGEGGREREGGVYILNCQQLNREGQLGGGQLSGQSKITQIHSVNP